MPAFCLVFCASHLAQALPAFRAGQAPLSLSLPGALLARLRQGCPASGCASPALSLRVAYPLFLVRWGGRGAAELLALPQVRTREETWPEADQGAP